MRNSSTVSVLLATLLAAIAIVSCTSQPPAPLPKRELPKWDSAQNETDRYASEHVAAGIPTSGTGSNISTTPASLPPWQTAIGVLLVLSCGWGLRKRQVFILTVPGLIAGLVLLGLALQPTFLWPPSAYPWWKVLHILEALGLLLLWSAFKGLPGLKKIEFDDAILCVFVFVFVGLAALGRALGWEHSFLASTYWWALAFVWVWSVAEAIWTGLATRTGLRGLLLFLGWGLLFLFS